jgi:hypothetical protein
VRAIRRALPTVSGRGRVRRAVVRLARGRVVRVTVQLDRAHRHVTRITVHG